MSDAALTLTNPVFNKTRNFNLATLKLLFFGSKLAEQKLPIPDNYCLLNDKYVLGAYKFTQSIESEILKVIPLEKVILDHFYEVYYDKKKKEWVRGRWYVTPIPIELFDEVNRTHSLKLLEKFKP